MEIAIFIAVILGAMGILSLKTLAMEDKYHTNGSYKALIWIQGILGIISCIICILGCIALIILAQGFGSDSGFTVYGFAVLLLGALFGGTLAYRLICHGRCRRLEVNGEMQETNFSHLQRLLGIFAIIASTIITILCITL